jgi:hypothetical protein
MSMGCCITVEFHKPLSRAQEEEVRALLANRLRIFRPSDDEAFWLTDPDDVS